MAIYTKAGDRGKTSTFSGRRILKSSKLIDAIGAIDELNSFLGILGHGGGKMLEIQQNLFTINAILAGAKLKLSRSATKKLESEIDKIEQKLPVQKNFLIYGGTKRATELYFARSLCRRAERRLASLKIAYPRLEILSYINRLSDFLFIQARLENHKAKVTEKFWKG